METMKRSFSDALMDIDINLAEYTTPFYHQPKKHQKGLESAEAEQPVGRQYKQKRRHLNLENEEDDWEVNQQSDLRKKRVCLEIEKDFDRLSLSSKDSLENYALVHVPKPKLDKVGGLAGFVDLKNHSNWPVYLRVEDVTENDNNLNGNGQLICWKGKENNLHHSYEILNTKYSVLEIDDFDPEALCNDHCLKIKKISFLASSPASANVCRVHSLILDPKNNSIMTAYLTNLPKNNSKKTNASPLHQRIVNEGSHLSFYATAKFANLASVKEIRGSKETPIIKQIKQLSGFHQKQESGNRESLLGSIGSSGVGSKRKETGGSESPALARKRNTLKRKH